MSDELKQRLDQGMYGNPQLKPDEQRKYLGTFRERCYLQMTIAQMEDSHLTKRFKEHLSDFPSATCLLNGAVSETIQATYLSLLANAGMNFTIVSSDTETTTTSIGLLLVAKQAVNEPVIDIAKKYQMLNTSVSESTKKPSFWQRLVNFNK